MKSRIIIGALVAGVLVAGCNGRQNSAIPSTPVANAPVSSASADTSIPPSYRCLPSNLPSVVSKAVNPSLAYMSQCSVAGAKEAANLQKLAVAMVYRKGSKYIEYCTGTPLSYDPDTGVGIIVSAAHCVVGGRKAAGAQLSAANITTFADKNQWVYQNTPAIFTGSTNVTGIINAVYVPSRYCLKPAFSADGTGCSNLELQNGDVAVIKIHTMNQNPLETMPKLQLAPPWLTMPEGSPIMALGYGTNTSSTPDDRVLYYIDYQYFADDAYKGETAEAALMNGYHHNGNFYSIICQGDSGGGDFFWDGTHWNLVGAHSFGPTPCGVWGARYSKANDISADIRPWTAWIQKVVDDDTDVRGCASLGSRYVCAAR